MTNLPAGGQGNGVLVWWLVGALFAVVMFGLTTLITNTRTDMQAIETRLDRLEARLDVYAEINRSFDRRLEWLESARSVPR